MDANACIGVAIVHYRTPELLLKCLFALSREREKHPNMKVCVVDNASGDHEVNYLCGAIKKNLWSDWIHLESAPRNGGFAYGNNLAVRVLESLYSSIEYIWLLNPDTVPKPNSLAPLIVSLSVDPLRIIGSKLTDHDGTVQKSCFRYPSVATELSSAFRLGAFDRLMARYIYVQNGVSPDWMAGASLFFCKELYWAVSGMDEKYFLYFEEIDFLKKASLLGYRCHYQTMSRVAHEVGASTGISEYRNAQPRRPRYWFESRQRYFLRHRGLLYLAIVDVLWSLGYSSWRVRKWLQRSDELSKEPAFLLTDFIRYSILNPINWRWYEKFKKI